MYPPLTLIVTSILVVTLAPSSSAQVITMVHDVIEPAASTSTLVARETIPASSMVSIPLHVSLATVNVSGSAPLVLSSSSQTILEATAVPPD